MACNKPTTRAQRDKEKEVERKEKEKAVEVEIQENMKKELCNMGEAARWWNKQTWDMPRCFRSFRRPRPLFIFGPSLEDVAGRTPQPPRT